MPTAVPFLALDLSLAATGLAHTHDNGSIELRTLTSHRRGTPRLCDLVDQIMDIAVRLVPVVAVIEDLPPVRANALGALGMLHGAVRVSLFREGCDLAFVPPATLKKYATGRGNATKPDMRMALYQRAGLDVRDDNQVDAWWLAAMAADQYGAPLVALPEAQRAALEKVDWPEGLELAEGYR